MSDDKTRKRGVLSPTNGTMQMQQPTHPTSKTYTTTQLQSATKLIARHKTNQSEHWSLSDTNTNSRKNSNNNKLSVDYNDYDDDDDNNNNNNTEYQSDSNRNSLDNSNMPRRLSNRKIPPPPPKSGKPDPNKSIPPPPPSPPPPSPPMSKLPPNRRNRPKNKQFTKKTNDHNLHNNLSQITPSLLRQQQSAPIEDEFNLNDHEHPHHSQYEIMRKQMKKSKSEAVLTGWNNQQNNNNRNNNHNAMQQLRNGGSTYNIQNKHNPFKPQITSTNPQTFTFVDYEDENNQTPINVSKHRRKQQKPSNKNKKKVNFGHTENIIIYGSDYENEVNDTDDDDDNIQIDPSRPDPYKTVSLPESLNNEQTALQDLHDMILLYQQAVHDVHQAIVDVKETSQDITYKVKSVTEQLHMIIDRREDELLEEITTKTASKLFALDTQFTKLQQRLMFCRTARDEAEELLIKHNEYNEYNDHENNSSLKPLPKSKSSAYPANGIKSNNNNNNKKGRTREHSGGSVTNYNARKDRIMAIVNKAKQDAKIEFEKELNRGTAVVNTRFHVEHYDITEQLETLGNIIDDEPLQQYQLYPPAIIKTKAFKRSVRIAIKSREKIDHSTEHQILTCQFEPQLVFATAKELKIQERNNYDDINHENIDNMNNKTESYRANRQHRQSITSLPEHLSDPQKLNWQSLGWIELNPAPIATQMFGKPKNQMDQIKRWGSNELNNRNNQELPSWNVSQQNSAPTLSNLQKLKKELDLDHMITEYTKLITGLEDILNDADGKYTYIRVRMRKLVKFEQDIHNNHIQRKKKKKKKKKNKHSKRNKSNNLDVNSFGSLLDDDDEDFPPFWVESHFSRPVRLFLRSTGTQIHGLLDNNNNNNNNNKTDLPLPVSLADLSNSMSPSYEDEPQPMDDDFFDDDLYDEKYQYNQYNEHHRKKKSKKKSKKGGAETKKSRNRKKKERRGANSSIPAAQRASDLYDNMPPYSPKYTTTGSLYESDSEFTKQRRHSNYHIQDELYQPGILLLDKSRIIWHDIVNNTDNIVSDKIPVAARSSCGMVVAHDVLVADDEYDDNQSQQQMDKIDDDLLSQNQTDPGSRYTSIMFRIGGTLNKKTDRSVDMIDLGTGMWSSLPGLKHARSQCQPALMNGNIVCAGGCGKKTKPLSSVELFDFEESRWKELTSLQTARWGHAVYVMYYEDNEQIARTPSVVSSITSVPESAKLIVAGGWSKKKKNLQTAEIYDISTNRWTFIAPMNVPRSRCVAMEWTSIDRVGVIGGWGNSTKIVEYYDSNKDSWFRLKDLNHEHIYPSCGLLSDQHLYAMNRFLESDAKQIIRSRHEQEQQQQSHKISLIRGRPAPFVLGSNDQLSCLELFDDRSDQWIILQTFPHSQNTIHSMIECALPANVTSTLTTRTRGYSNYSTSSVNNQWQRRGSKILGML